MRDGQRQLEPGSFFTTKPGSAQTQAELGKEGFAAAI
jgi:hypothetical protein